MEVLTQGAAVQEFRKGSRLFHEGDKQSGLICIVSGKVKAFKQGAGGRDQIVKLLKSNDFLGYSALFGDKAWHVTADAIEDTITCNFETSSFLKVLRKNADLSLRILEKVTSDIDCSENRTVSLTQKHVRGRIAESLLMLAEVYGYEADCKTINISLSREDVACLSNMTTSNAIRTLSLMAEEGNIELNGRKISILDRCALMHISQFG